MYIKSKDIKVYPSAYRGSITQNGEKKIFNPDSRLNIEENLIRYYTSLSTNTSGYKEKGSFVIAYDKNAKTIEFVVKGYYFKISNTDQYFNNSWENDCYFVRLNISPKGNVQDSNNVDYAAYSLSPTDNTNADILDVSNSGQFNFVGLKLLYGYITPGMTKQEIEEELGSPFDLCILSAGEVPETALLKINREDIDGTGNGTPLTTQLNTNNIITTNIYRDQNSTTASTIGISTDPFKDGFITNITTNKILPNNNTDSTIGGSSNYFKNLYVNTINTNSVNSSSVDSSSISIVGLYAKYGFTTHIGESSRYFKEAYLEKTNVDELLPKSATSTLGKSGTASAGNRFKNAYIDTADILHLTNVTDANITTGDITTGNITNINTDKILPTGSNKAIGDSGNTFKNAYIDDVVASRISGSLKCEKSAPSSQNPDWDTNYPYYKIVLLTEQQASSATYQKGYLYFITEN